MARSRHAAIAVAGMFILLNVGLLCAGDETLNVQPAHKTPRLLDSSDGQDDRSKSVAKPQSHEPKIEFRLVSTGKPVEGVTEKEGFQKGYSGQRSMVYPYKKPFFSITGDKIAKLSIPPSQYLGSITLTRKAQTEMFAAMNTPEAKARGRFIMFVNGKRLNRTTHYVGAYGNGRDEISVRTFHLKSIFGSSIAGRNDSPSPPPESVQPRAKSKTADDSKSIEIIGRPLDMKP